MRVCCRRCALLVLPCLDASCCCVVIVWNSRGTQMARLAADIPNRCTLRALSSSPSSSTRPCRRRSSRSWALTRHEGESGADTGVVLQCCLPQKCAIFAVGRRAHRLSSPLHHRNWEAHVLGHTVLLSTGSPSLYSAKNCYLDFVLLVSQASHNTSLCCMSSCHIPFYRFCSAWTVALMVR
jgi:hypothetical protein